MFGRGVIATIYGEALRQAAHDVEFYVRPGRAAQYGESVEADVVDVRRGRRDRRVRQAYPVRLRESLDADDGFELVVLSVPHQRLREAAEFLAPRIGSATVLVFGNVWQEARDAVAPLPEEQVVFGFPQAGGGFAEDGTLRGVLMRSVIVGRSGATASPRESAVRAALQQAGFRVREEVDMRGWLMIHFAADAGMFAQGVHSGSLAAMIGDRRAFRGALITARELLPVLTDRGVDLRRHRLALLPYELPTLTAAAMAWVTARSASARLSLAAHTDSGADEPRAVLRDALEEARRRGIAAPRLAAAYGLLG